MEERRSSWPMEMLQKYYIYYSEPWSQEGRLVLKIIWSILLDYDQENLAPKWCHIGTTSFRNTLVLTPSMKPL
jgi:hypothetical protein